MSDIQVTAQTLSSIVPHPNVGKLNIATTLGTQTLVAKGQEMKANCKSWVRVVLTGVLYSIIVQLSLPFIGGLYYATCGDHDDEQMYLDHCIQHLKLLRHCTHDPDLQGVLDYAIQRYNRVGPWDVMFMPLNGPPGGKTLGCNCPWCPGITLDPCLLRWEPEDTALVIAHEAMHDYYPFFGHSFHATREPVLYELSYALRRLYRSHL